MPRAALLLQGIGKESFGDKGRFITSECFAVQDLPLSAERLHESWIFELAEHELSFPRPASCFPTNQNVQ